MTDATFQGEILNQALPYIQKFQGATFVIKYGGSAMRDPRHLRTLTRNVLMLQLVGIKPILVHGGGPEIDKWLQKLGIPKQTVGGLRVTDDATMEVVEMALGRANKSLVSEIQQAGGQAVGVSGRDGNLLVAEPVSEELGRVGSVVQVNPGILGTLLEGGFVPVVCSVGTDAEGNAMNVNADAAAAAIAGALHATKLVLMLDTDGVLSDRTDASSLITRLSAARARQLIANGKASDGMIPKLEAALEALDDGVGGVHLLNGKTPNALLIEVFTDAGIGTMMTR